MVCSIRGKTSRNIGFHLFQIVELLLKKGASPNVTDKYGSTPLHRAASLGHTSITKLLLEFRADPNLSNSEGNTPL